jgi:hypothetical protein
MPRRLLTLLCTVAAVATLGGCGGAATPAGGAATPAGGGPGSEPPASASASPRPTTAPVDLKKTAPCTLAAGDEAAAALAAPVTQSYSVSPMDGIGCEYDTASKEVYLLIQVQNDPDTYFDPKYASNARKIDGLGDGAYTSRSILDGGEKIEVLVGGLVLTIQRIDPAKGTDLGAIDDRLARLARVVIPRLPH